MEKIVKGILGLVVAVLCFVFADEYTFMLFRAIPIDLNIVGIVAAALGVFEIVTGLKKK